MKFYANTLRFNYEWSIDNFSLRREEIDEALTSSTFCTGPDADELQWCLQIYPKGDDGTCTGYISLFLELVQCNKTEVFAKYKFSILDVEQRKAHTLGKDYAPLIIWFELGRMLKI